MVPPRPWAQISVFFPAPAERIESRPDLRVRTDSKVSRDSSVAPLVAARNPTPTWRLPRMRSFPRRKALIPPRTSAAIWRQVALSAVRVASGWVPSRGG